LDDLVNEDIAAVEEELTHLAEPISTTKPTKKQPKRTPLPENLPRTVVEHEPGNSHCSCGCQLKRIGEDVREKLDYIPSVFTVEHHVRGK